MKSYERREQVARAMQKEIGMIIQSGAIKDDRMDKFVSIIEVSLNSSLSSARVYYSILTNDAELDDIAKIGTQAALVENAGYLRGLVGRRLNLRYAPKLYFEASDSLSRSVDMVDLLERTVQNDDDKKGYSDEEEE